MSGSSTVSAACSGQRLSAGWDAWQSPAEARLLDSWGVCPAVALDLLGRPRPGALGVLVRAANEVRRFNLDRRDLGLWVHAGLVTLDPLHIDQDTYWRWRRLTSHGLSLRTAAIAAAAGYSPEETEQMLSDGTFDVVALARLARLGSA